MPMSERPHFKWFNQALDGLALARPNQSVEAEFVARAIVQGQRFYMPGYADVLGGKSYTDIGEQIAMPFDLMAVAVEDREDGELALLSVICAEKTPDGYLLVPIAGNGGLWGLLPQVRMVWHPDRAEFSCRFTTQYGLENARDWDQEQVMRLGDIAAYRQPLHTLNAMLSLSNVQSVQVEPPPVPEKVQRKRQRTGKLPLYSYHVLEVGGEKWDSFGADDGDGQGFRSHLRRGHIRRLGDSRKVWVRSCFVHGRIPGFVDKDYNVRGPQA